MSEGNVMKDIHEFMGEMKSHIVHIREKTEVISSDVKDLRDRATEHEMKIESAHNRIDKIAPKVEELHSYKNKAVGIFGFIGFIAGSAGVFLAKIVGLFN